jgi:hypothetical protein
VAAEKHQYRQNKISSPSRRMPGFLPYRKRGSSQSNCARISTVRAVVERGWTGGVGGRMPEGPRASSKLPQFYRWARWEGAEETELGGRRNRRRRRRGGGKKRFVWFRSRGEAFVALQPRVHAHARTRCMDRSRTATEAGTESCGCVRVLAEEACRPAAAAGKETRGDPVVRLLA